jgi:nicotinamide-nucleotide amidase
MIGAKFHAAIITIGDEILIGQITDTNSAWLGQELGKMGVRVNYRCSVGDVKEHIINALNQAQQYADIIITTGGLGPTKDDVTKQTLCEYFNTSLIENKEVLDWVTKIFRMRKLPMIDSNKFQAMVPENCEVLFNSTGTAPGMLFMINGKMVISLPGVPFEMKNIFEEHCTSKIKSTFKLPSIIHRTIQTTSIGESFLAEKIKDWEDKLPAHINLAYLPSVGQVRLRLSGYSDDLSSLNNEMNGIISDLYNYAGEYIFGEEDTSLQKAVGELLKTNNTSLSTAESCTGGYLAHLITSVPGSSSYYKGSIIAYDNKIKMAELGFTSDILNSVGAVSEACVKKMAEGVRLKMQTDYGIATSGIAGPDGGTNEKPVGTVWIAISSSSTTFAKQFNMGDNRERTILRTALQGLDMLRKTILEENKANL